MPAANGSLRTRIEIDEKARKCAAERTGTFRDSADGYAASSQCTLKSPSGSHHIVRGMKPAAIASDRKPSGVYL
jgi:hypothetical protein